MEVRIFMEENQIATKELIQVELFNVQNYLDRLMFVLHDHADITHLPVIKKEVVNLNNELKSCLSDQLNFQFTESTLDHKASFLVKEYKEIQHLFESYLKLSTLNQHVINTAIYFINALYYGAFELHKKVRAHTELEVQIPRFTLSDLVKTENEIKFFQINEHVFTSYQNLDQAIIEIVDYKKEELYDRNLKKGHFFLLNKKFAEARDCFNKAKNFKTTAEIFTLLGHLCAKENNVEKAKEYCLKAIKTDSNYGAPYNDYGVYLLNEGFAKDSLKWFSMAKKSISYQNRDFAFINAGRAYFAMNEYELAIDEFQKALALNPENEELQTMVLKIKENLETRDLKDFMLKFKPESYNELNQ